MALTPTGHGRLRGAGTPAAKASSPSAGPPCPSCCFRFSAPWRQGPRDCCWFWGAALVMVPAASELPDTLPDTTLPRLIVLLISLGAFLVGGLLVGLVMLVTTLGFCRGAWLALEGHRPRFADLIRWHGAAINRLILAWTAWQLLLLVALVPLGPAGPGPGCPGPAGPGPGCPGPAPADLVADRPHRPGDWHLVRASPKPSSIPSACCRTPSPSQRSPAASKRCKFSGGVCLASVDSWQPWWC
jgi:hypothetical protein